MAASPQARQPFSLREGRGPSCTSARKRKFFRLDRFPRPFRNFHASLRLFILQAGKIANSAEKFLGGFLSPLAQQKRMAAAGAQPNPMAQHWAMLLFESFSAGVMAIFAGFVSVTVVVGLYVIVVWPLTFWDLANLRLERFNSWIHPILWSVFGVGSLVGFLCFSGLAFNLRRRKSASAMSGTRRMVFHPRRPAPAKAKNGPVRTV